VIRRIGFAAGGDAPWTLSALETPRDKPAPWKIVVITGAPSWAEYWAPAMADLPADREMVVVDRPGYANSEPAEPVTDIREQAIALMPVLHKARGQKLMLVGQSYGAGIATLMADMSPKSVDSLVMLSSFLGELGPASRWLVETGQKVLGVIPKDLRNAVIEVSGQAPQLDQVREALERLPMPIHVVHGDKDDFAPMEYAQRLALETRTRRPINFHMAEGVDHFINDGPAEAVIEVLERCVPTKTRSFELPKIEMPKVELPKLPEIRLPAMPGMTKPMEPQGA
jgi:pimeloyl-ACP methyl ester carboxylesterase